MPYGYLTEHLQDFLKEAYSEPSVYYIDILKSALTHYGIFYYFPSWNNFKCLMSKQMDFYGH